MLNCNADLDARSTRTVTLTNDGSTAIRMGRASLGGRHPEAFAIDVDGCSDRTLAAGADCEVDVTYLGDQVRGNPHLHAVLKMPNDDSLAPQLALALFAEQVR